MTTAYVELEREDGPFYVTVEGTVEWSGRGRRSYIECVEVESAKCSCGHAVELTDAERRKCERALEQSSDEDKAELFISAMGD